MDVALLGVVAPGMENHSLAVLGDALRAAGLRHGTIAFEGFAGMERMLAEVLRARPRVCGVSVQTTEALLASVAFTRLLRGRGYDGTIVVGGHVAALAGDDLLSPATGVDVVVELAGEDALVGLARGADPLTLPGARTRAGRGRPPIAVRPRAIRREQLSEHLGFGAADLIASRGCGAHCGYCCVAAVSELAERSGGARHEARELAALADELADVAARGGRAFHFMDDNLLPLEPERAVAWVRALREALDARRVPRIAFSLQLRADVVTPALADALADAGLVRAYVGIDGYSAAHLRAIGRAAPARAGTAAIDALRARGVYCVANALIVGPTIRLETIAGEIDGLAAVRGAPVHLLPIEARPGTIHHRRAAARGLIEGGPLWPVYRFDDPRAFLVAEVLTSLPTRLAERSVPIALYDLAWALGVARRLAPAADVAAADATYAAVTDAWNADQLRVLRAATAAAPRGRAAIDELLARERPVVRAHDDALLGACDDALAAVERAVSRTHRRAVRAHARGRALGGIAVAMGLAAACGGNHRAPADARFVDGTPGAPDAMVVDATPGAPDAMLACTDPARTAEAGVYLDPGPGCTCGEAVDTQVRVTFDANGNATAVTTASGQPLPTAMAQCFLDLLAPYCYPSLAGMTQTVTTCHAWIA
jgi:hypothetical protein